MGADKTLLMRLTELNEVIEADDDGTVSESEYILFNLRKMGKVDMDTIILLREQFKTLCAYTRFEPAPFPCSKPSSDAKILPSSY